MSLNIFRSDADLQEDIASAERHAKRDAVKNRIRYSLVAILLAIIPLAGLALVATTLYGMYEEYQKHQTLEETGIETEAFIQNEYIEVTRASQKTYRLRYSIKVNDQYFQGESEVNQLPISFGIPQRAIYDPSYPENSKLKGSKDEFEYGTSPFLEKMSALLILGLIIWLIKYGGNKMKKELESRKSIAARTRFVVDQDGVVHDVSDE